MSHYQDHPGPFTCEQCGESFPRRVGSRPNPRYCSVACRAVAVGNAKRTSANPRKGRTCIQCGCTYDAGNTEQTCCSIECRRAYDAARRPAPKPKASRVYFPTCKGCARTFTARASNARWCSYRCRVNDINDRCTSLYALACDIKRPGEAHMWRTVLVGYLIERDGDRCPLCRKRLDPSLPSGPRGDRMGVSIDHIVPRSQGGSDDLANLRAVHWHENQRRGNRGGHEQLALVG